MTFRRGATGEVGVLRVLFPYFTKETSWPWAGAESDRESRFRTALRRRYYEHFWRKRLSRYKVRAANSEFTRRWTERSWGVESDVVYPPVDRQFKQQTKEKLILSVGRICRMKRQLEMVHAFRQLDDLHRDGWRFCVAGGIASDMPETRKYLDEIQSAGDGYPVDVCVGPEKRNCTTFMNVLVCFGMRQDLESI